MSQRRKYVRRNKKNIREEPSIEPLDSSKIEQPSVIPVDSKSIISEQDEDFEISVIMDMIRIQEREEKEKLEKEMEIQKKYSQELQQKIQERDSNIKNILRKIKFGTGQSSIEKNIVNLLENFMETQEMYIQLDNTELYEQISSYLGIKDNTKGIIRLTDDIKAFAKNIFIPPI